MTRRSTTAPCATIESIMDMIISSLNGLLDFIEIQLAYFMLKNIPGNLRSISDQIFVGFFLMFRQAYYVLSIC